jgi:hypothetical protein
MPRTDDDGGVGNNNGDEPENDLDIEMARFSAGTNGSST